MKCEKSEFAYYAGLLQNNPIALEVISLVKEGHLELWYLVVVSLQDLPNYNQLVLGK